ncbi:uncharacterized protein GGS25DRAFT_503408, partial [Hypoxylon fragiforme]|uniref:uncharacterized protein n=1 Tax=Hypoxylon fragiforme TaxID=63214 RepID=UPI0020C6115B
MSHRIPSFLIVKAIEIWLAMLIGANSVVSGFNANWIGTQWTLLLCNDTFFDSQIVTSNWLKGFFFFFFGKPLL